MRVTWRSGPQVLISSLCAFKNTTSGIMKTALLRPKFDRSLFLSKDWVILSLDRTESRHSYFWNTLKSKEGLVDQNSETKVLSNRSGPTLNKRGLRISRCLYKKLNLVKFRSNQGGLSCGKRSVDFFFNWSGPTSSGCHGWTSSSTQEVARCLEKL